jgi:ATP-dependent helicase/nuclease subunit A
MALNLNVYSPVLVQKWASNPADNIYLAASAGTGKTKTLVDRMLRLLLDGVKIEEILCITFTNAAANEMLERLKVRLEQWFLMDDERLRLEIEELVGKSMEDERLKYAKQLYLIYLDNFDKFRVQTLHSFCVKVLSQMHYIDENELDQIKIIDNYAKKKLIENAYEKVISLSLSKH